MSNHVVKEKNEAQNANLLLCTDVYKLGHMDQYKPGITNVYSYLCARSTKKSPYTLWFGLQYFIKEYLMRPITEDNVEEFFEYYELLLGKPTPDSIKTKIWSLQKLGYLPIEIKAVPEGTIIGNKNVLCTITNTVPGFHWVVGFIESLILKVWNTCSVATASLKFKRLVTAHAKATSDSEFLVPYQVHDFGYRGCSSEETAFVGGAAHLLNFLGTDTVIALKMLKKYYKADVKDGTIGCSVTASEHSIMCSFGKEGEIDGFRNMIRSNSGIVSIVSDTYDFWNVMTTFTRQLKDEILARDGKIVFRPDSGDPQKIICGDPDAPVGSPQYKGAILLLDEVFGHTVNSKGFKELNPKVGLIYGDGMYYERFEQILIKLKEMGYASTNLVIGIGGLLLQQHNRDDMGFAFKATFAIINGEEVELFKDPVTDPGKRSHKGRMKLVKDENGEYRTIDQVSEEDEKLGELITIFKNNVLYQDYSLKGIRNYIERQELTIRRN